MKKCVMAYSGGLDTSAMVPWLIERGYEVHAVLVDVGQEEDLPALCQKALKYGAKSAVIRDAKPAIYRTVVPFAAGLAATYEGTYRLGTALARPFIAAEQVAVAKQLGGATLVHGATGKGNDQIRFEFAYRSLAPQLPVLAPWKVWDFNGRADLVNFLKRKGIDGQFEIMKEFSLDENFWHLSIEGGPLEDVSQPVDVEAVLKAHAKRFAGGARKTDAPAAIEVEFVHGLPIAVDGEPQPLSAIVPALNRRFRSAPWAWDLVIENRFTGIKSRGLYINPAAKLLHIAVDGLARTCLNKPSFEQYAALGKQYADVIYRGEYFSDQRVVLEAAATALLQHLTGTVQVRFAPAPHVAKVAAAKAIFRKDVATFEKSDFSHADAAGFIRLNWLSSIGKPFAQEEVGDEHDALEGGGGAAPRVRKAKPVPGKRLVPASA
jgi:argininosuccinate synthase